MDNSVLVLSKMVKNIVRQVRKILANTAIPIFEITATGKFPNTAIHCPPQLKIVVY